MTILLLTLAEKAVNTLSDDMIWYGAHYHSLWAIVAVLWFLLRNVSYKQLEVKTVVAVWFAVAFTDVLLYPFWFLGYDTYYIASCVKFLTVSAILVLVFWRSYRMQSEEMKTGHVYLVRRIPDGPQDFILSLFFRQPVGGAGIALNGDWYHFHRGTLVKHPINRINHCKYVIVEIRGSRSSDHLILNNLLGAKWTWLVNCMTILYPLARWGRPAPWIQSSSGNL